METTARQSFEATKSMLELLGVVDAGQQLRDLLIPKTDIIIPYNTGWTVQHVMDGWAAQAHVCTRHFREYHNETNWAAVESGIILVRLEALPYSEENLRNHRELLGEMDLEPLPLPVGLVAVLLVQSIYPPLVYDEDAWLTNCAEEGGKFSALLIEDKEILISQYEGSDTSDYESGENEFIGGMKRL